jgi:hypothetical protein
MFPNPLEGKRGLAHIEDDVFVSKQVQVQGLPLERTLLNEHEPF